MSITIPLLAFLMLIFPGFVFLKGYFSHPNWSANHVSISMFSIFSNTILPAFIILICTLFIFNSIGHFVYYPYSISLKEVFLVLTGDATAIENSIRIIKKYPILILFFGFISIALGYIQGFYLMICVRHWRLDHKIRQFRFPNDWFYILTGEYVKFSENKRNHKYSSFSDDRDGIGVVARALFETNNGDVIYTGMVESFNLNSEKEGLEDITLNDVYRTDYDHGKTIVSEIPMVDDLIILPFKNIRNLKINYISLSEQDLLQIKKETDPYIQKREKVTMLHIFFTNVSFVLVALLYTLANHWDVLYFALPIFILIFELFICRFIYFATIYKKGNKNYVFNSVSFALLIAQALLLLSVHPI